MVADFGTKALTSNHLRFSKEEMHMWLGSGCQDERGADAEVEAIAEAREMAERVLRGPNKRSQC